MTGIINSQPALCRTSGAEHTCMAILGLLQKMSFSKYISQTPQDFGQALQVSGFIVSNGSSTAPYTENLQRGSNDLFTGGANYIYPIKSML